MFERKAAGTAAWTSSTSSSAPSKGGSGQRPNSSRNAAGSSSSSQSATMPAANSSGAHCPASKRRTHWQLSQRVQSASSLLMPLNARMDATPPGRISTPPRSNRTRSIRSPFMAAMLGAVRTRFEYTLFSSGTEERNDRMKLSMTLNYAGGFAESAKQAVELEKVGLDVVWVAEAYSFDAPSFMGFLAAKTERLEIGSAILPIYSRTPTLIAMTAAGVDAVSGGRCILGLGASGPQVIEGFHGVPYDRPLGRTREIIEICRDVWAREVPLTHDGTSCHIPLPAGEGTGLGKPLKLLNLPVRSRIPIWLPALGEKNVAMTAEVSDGWLPIFFVPEKAKDVFGASLSAGRAARDAALGPLEIAAGGMLAIGEESEVAAVRDLGRGAAALYIGGMGAKGKNFYNALACRYGYEKEAAEIQDLYLSGKKKEAAALVPAELLDGTSLCGPESYIKERVAGLAEVGVTHLNVTPVGTDPVAMVEKLRSWV